MKKYLVDIVNLNADASCLSSARWLQMLQGKTESELYRFFQIYVDQGKKVSLGIPGCSLVDIVSFNPEVIELIKSHPDIFEIILRPFAHDIALLRTTEGFKANLAAGIKTLQSLSLEYTPYYLPPEFMLTSEQVFCFAEFSVEGTFIHPTRFRQEVRNRIPEQPYRMQGIMGSSFNAIPFKHGLTNTYLDSIHAYNATVWNKEIIFAENDNIFCWRDGESTFFIPDGNRREAAWLADEHPEIERVFLKDQVSRLEFVKSEDLEGKKFHYYPVHSFSAWMKEFRMLGFIQRLKEIEENLSGLSSLQKAIWLTAINSDILSAVEKDSPVIKIKPEPNSTKKESFTIWRSERNFEGQEYLHLLLHADQPEIKDYLQNSKAAHIQKLRRRIQFIDEQAIF